MRLYPSLEQVATVSPSGRAVAIGVFDGVHRGHQRILGRAVEWAAAAGTLSTAVTFYPHPETVLRPRYSPKMLTSLERKMALLEELGLDEVVVVRFGEEFARLSPESFCRTVLSARLGARVVFVGENFRFGYQGAGAVADLLEYGSRHDFEVQAVSLVEEAGEIVSSTHIRALLRAGQVKEAARLLGRPHRLEGTVASGAGRGRQLDAPTANLPYDRDMALPRAGVYATLSVVDGSEPRLSVTSVGTNPTFESDRKIRVETLILDYSGDLYGRHLAVDFVDRIRGQQTFPDAGSLAGQIKDDVAAARRLHAAASDPKEGS